MGLLVNDMKNETEIREEIDALRSLTKLQLKDKYRELFGEQSRSNHKQWRRASDRRSILDCHCRAPR